MKDLLKGGENGIRKCGESLFMRYLARKGFSSINELPKETLENFISDYKPALVMNLRLLERLRDSNKNTKWDFTIKGYNTIHDIQILFALGQLKYTDVLFITNDGPIKSAIKDAKCTMRTLSPTEYLMNVLSNTAV